MNSRPVFKGLEHLAWSAGVHPDFLQVVEERRQDPYYEFRLPKNRGGSYRTIAAPLPELARAQKWILDNVLSGPRAQNSSFAYTKGVSVRNCASVHAGARWLVKLDLRDFFHSVDEARVARIFLRHGLEETVAGQLARLCTRRPPSFGGRGPQIATSRGYLPQGAPTSGMLANLAAGDLDCAMSRLAWRYGLRYTRYSDDLTFSSRGEFSRSEVLDIIRRARSKITAAGFLMNEGKIKVSPPGSRLVVLGLLVDSDKVRLQGDFKKALRWHHYGVSRFGLEQYSASKGFESGADYMLHVNGLFSHAIAIEPEWARPLRDSWTAAAVSYSLPR